MILVPLVFMFAQKRTWYVPAVLKVYVPVTADEPLEAVVTVAGEVAFRATLVVPAESSIWRTFG